MVKFNLDIEKIENNSDIFDEISELQGMKRFCIFKYYEDINMLLPVETSYDEGSNTIYTETDELGTYCVMDMESWISSFDFDEEEPYNEEQYQYPDEAIAPMSIEESSDESKLTETEKEQCSVKVFDSDIDEFFDETEEETAMDLPIQTYSSRSITTSTNKTPLDVVFVLEQAGAQKSAFEHQKKAIQYAARNIFALHSDVRIYIIGFNKNSASFYKASSSNYLVNANQVNTALNKMSYTITNDYSNRGAAFNLLMNNVSFRNYAAKFTFLILNGATNVRNGYKSQLDFCSKRDVNYSEVMAYNHNYNKTYDNKVRGAVLQSGGIFIYDNQQLQFHILNHVISNTSTSNTQFDIALPTNFRRISLKSPLSPTSNTDSDSDGLRDWAEADIQSGLIKWDNSGNVVLPTLKDCLFKASNHDAIFNACLTYAKYLPRSMNYILKSPVLPIHSNPCAIDSDGDGIIDPNEYRNVTKDSRYNNLNPLLSDTIERLYPELKGKNSNNKKENPIYLDIKNNTITFKVKYSLGGLAEQRSNIKIPKIDMNYTNEQIIFSSIRRKWNTTVNGNEFDFYPGMKIDIKVEFEKKSFGQKYIKFNVVNCGDYTTSKWTTKCNKVITVGIKDDKGNFLPELNRFASPAHEFGHALGLTDIYGYDKNSDWRLQPAIYNINKRGQNEIWYNKSGNNYDGDLMYSFGKVRANDIEMILQAYCENEKQYFRPEFDKNNHVSKAIKQNSNNVYLDRTNNNFVIYIPSTKETTQIGDVTAYKSWLYDKYKINVSVDDLNHVYFG